MAAVRHLVFVMRVLGTTRIEVRMVVFITVQNFVGIDAVVLIIIICTFFDFASLAENACSPPKFVFFGLIPKWGAM